MAVKMLVIRNRRETPVYKFKEANLFVFSDCIGIALPIKNDAKVTFKFICLTKWWDQRTNTMMMFDETGLSAYNNADNITTSSTTPSCSSSTNTSSTSASIAEYLALPELDDTNFGPQIVLDDCASASDSEDLSFSSVDSLSFGSSHENHSPRGDHSFGLSTQQLGSNGNHSPAEAPKDHSSPNVSSPSVPSPVSSSSALSSGSSKSKRRSSRSSRSRSRSRSSTIIDPTTQPDFAIPPEVFAIQMSSKTIGILCDSIESKMSCLAELERIRVEWLIKIGALDILLPTCN
eukprot:TRINITY_DN2559_c0_g2_i1.p1 TRINITY_DN2559_c0_g2~~TRINITY_DN2559_c0_g2_i1.p1  ORF type:complete len:290 (-),score=115.55 TRINITY_DN2559_c0_g2_i1:30-899(-)